MLDVIIVGGGLFGSIAAAALRDAGMDVALIDDGRPRSGSRAAGCLMKPSWLTRMGRDNVDASFRLLDRLYGLRTISLKAGPLSVNAEWINPDSVLASDRLKSVVTKVEPGVVHLHSGASIRASKAVVVASGVWTRDLIRGVSVVGKAGVSLRLPFMVAPIDNRISVWAPYKQLVRFAVPDENFYWAGDGTAILSKNWNQDRERACVDRIQAFAGSGKVQVGIRPFADTPDPAALEEVAPGLWSLTGGGKNGTAAAGWAAAKLLERLT